MFYRLLREIALLTHRQGKITDTDCLHQATADQAFTNAKAAGDVDAMTDALVFAALERNTGSVGLESVLCTAITAVNPEIAALSQHQDPAADGAAAKNKAITLELAKQIASIGGDPTIALQSGTFAPGTVSSSYCSQKKAAADMDRLATQLGLEIRATLRTMSRVAFSLKISLSRTPHWTRSTLQ